MGSRQRPIRWYHRRPRNRPSTFAEVANDPTTYRLATIPLDWHSIVHYMTFQGHPRSTICASFESHNDFLLVINSTLGPFAPFSHNTPVTDKQTRQTDGRTDGQTDDNHARPLLKYGRLIN